MERSLLPNRNISSVKSQGVKSNKDPTHVAPAPTISTVRAFVNPANAAINPADATAMTAILAAVPGIALTTATGTSRIRMMSQAMRERVSLSSRGTETRWIEGEREIGDSGCLFCGGGKRWGRGGEGRKGEVIDLFECPAELTQ